METEQKQKKILFAGLTILALAGIFLWSTSFIDRNVSVIQNTEPVASTIDLNDTVASRQMSEEEKRQVKSFKEGNLETISTENMSARSITTDLRSAMFGYDYNIDTENDEADCVYWKREDGANYGVNGWSVQSVRPDFSSITEDMELLEKFFTEHGFKRNELNTKKSDVSGADEPDYQTIGYENGNHRCLVGWSMRDGNPYPKYFRKYYFSVACVDYTAQHEQAYKIFSKILDDPKNFCVSKQEGNYAKGVVGEFSAPVWFAKRTGEKWDVIWTGQDDPICSDVKELPKSFYNKCYDPKTEKSHW